MMIDTAFFLIQITDKSDSASSISSETGFYWLFQAGFGVRRWAIWGVGVFPIAAVRGGCRDDACCCLRIDVVRVRAGSASSSEKAAMRNRMPAWTDRCLSHGSAALL